MPRLAYYGTSTEKEMLHQRARLARRFAEAEGTGLRSCVILGCGRPTPTHAGKGFSTHYCRYHVQLKARHGSVWKRSYTAPQLAPYRGAVERYLRSLGPNHPGIAGALDRLTLLTWRSGRAPRVVDMETMKPKAKARAVLARMKPAEVPMLRVLVNYLAVTAAYLDDPQAPAGDRDEFRLVQIAKVCLRLAGGDARVSGAGHYQRSSGMMLRALGKMVEEQCADFGREHMPAIRALRKREEERRRRKFDGRSDE